MSTEVHCLYRKYDSLFIDATLASAFYVGSKSINCYIRAFVQSQFLNKNIMINEIKVFLKSNKMTPFMLSLSITVVHLLRISRRALSQKNTFRNQIEPNGVGYGILESCRKHCKHISQVILIE